MWDKRLHTGRKRGYTMAREVDLGSKIIEDSDVGPMAITAGNEQYLDAQCSSMDELNAYFKEVERLGKASGTSCCDFCCIKTS
jgi:hypothetical protein